MTHADGRIRPVVNASNTTSMAYDYYVHDHLGNIRTVVSTQEPITSNYLAEHELVSANIEESIFDNIGSTRSGNPLQDIENMYASRLNAEEEERTVGTSLLLKVMPGDGFSIRAEAFYNSDNDNGNIDNQDLVDRLFNTLLNQGTQQGNPVGESGQSMELLGSLMGQNQLSDALNNIPIDNENPDAPQAYLNILFLKEDLSIQADKSRRIQVTTLSKDDWQAVKCQGCLTERIGVTVDEGGYLLIFVSNNSIGKDVWFDNISIQHERGYVLEENHYYPFGLTISSAAAGGVPNKYKFGGKELEQSFGLELYDFHARQYDPQLGRFTSVDPLADADKNIGYSPYVYAINNPITYTDPDGRCWQKVDDSYVPCDDASVGSTTTGAFGHSWTMTKNDGWQLTNGADPSTVNYEYDAIPASGNASYYEDRYKNHIEKYNTRPPDYYLGYGHKYINRFKNETRDKLTGLGKEWLDETAVALQQMMNQGISANPSIQGNNDAFQGFAYGTHVPAYSGSGKIGLLKGNDLWHIMWTPDIKDSFLSKDGVKQIMGMFPHILKSPRNPDLWNHEKNPGLLKPWEPKW